MGVSWHHANWLIDCQRRGLQFGRTLTLGRLHLFMSAEQLPPVVKHYRWTGGRHSTADVR